VAYLVFYTVGGLKLLISQFNRVSPKKEKDLLFSHIFFFRFNNSPIAAITTTTRAQKMRVKGFIVVFSRLVFLFIFAFLHEQLT
jgi:hypothetical protein